MEIVCLSGFLSTGGSCLGVTVRWGFLFTGTFTGTWKQYSLKINGP
jgi:hypothetical protein